MTNELGLANSFYRIYAPNTLDELHQFFKLTIPSVSMRFSDTHNGYLCAYTPKDGDRELFFALDPRSDAYARRTFSSESSVPVTLEGLFAASPQSVLVLGSQNTSLLTSLVSSLYESAIPLVVASQTKFMIGPKHVATPVFSAIDYALFTSKFS